MVHPEVKAPAGEVVPVKSVAAVMPGARGPRGGGDGVAASVIAGMGLSEAIEAMTGLAVPKHLAPLVAVLERAEREPVRAIVAMPPRHGKTTTIAAAMAWYLARDGGVREGYGL